jgi:S1-C subfamily serine protease
MRRFSLSIAILAGLMSGGSSVLAQERTALDPTVLEAQAKRVAVVEKVAPAVVAIFGPGGGGGGSGVLISPDGYVVTNFHVTNGAGDFMKCGLNDGKLYDAVIVGIDPTGDVALVKMLGRDDFPTAKMGDSDKVNAGDWCYAMGNPFLLANDFAPTVSYGIVSGTHRYQYPSGTFLEYTDCIQVDAAINPGNSGGPLFNDDGDIIGINGRGSFEKRGRVNSGAGYAISINQVRYFLGHLRSGRIVDHATLGASVATQSDGTVIVGSILEQSEAYRRGLRIDDEIVSFGGRPIRSVNQFKNILGIYPKGWKVPLVYRQNDQKSEVMVRLRALHQRSEFVPGGRKPQGRPMPEKPDGKPEEKKPDGKPGDPPKRPMIPGHAAPPKPPEQYKHMLVKKEGYANYWFNEQEQKRVLKAIQSLGDYSENAGAWLLAGKTAVDAPFEFILNDTSKEPGNALKWKDDAFLQKLGDNPPIDEPPGTGGLLMALQHLRVMLIYGADGFGRFEYLGTEPLDGNGPMVDVLVSSVNGLESRWYVRESDGVFAGFDTSLGEDMDECEIRFTDFIDLGSRRFPKQMTVNHAGRLFANFTIEKPTFQPGKRKELPKKVEEKKPDEKGEAKDEAKPERKAK